MRRVIARTDVKVFANGPILLDLRCAEDRDKGLYISDWGEN